MGVLHFWESCSHKYRLAVTEFASLLQHHRNHNDAQMALRVAVDCSIFLHQAVRTGMPLQSADTIGARAAQLLLFRLNAMGPAWDVVLVFDPPQRHHSKLATLARTEARQKAVVRQATIVEKMGDSTLDATERARLVAEAKRCAREGTKVPMGADEVMRRVIEERIGGRLHEAVTAPFLQADTQLALLFNESRVDVAMTVDGDVIFHMNDEGFVLTQLYFENGVTKAEIGAGLPLEWLGENHRVRSPTYALFERA